MTGFSQRFKEALGRKPNAEKEWRKHCQRLKNLDKKNNPGNYPYHRERDVQSAQKSGLRAIRAITDTHGSELTQSLVSALEGRGLALDTQVYFLRLCQAENPNHVVRALQDLPEALEENLKRPLSLQWNHYRDVLEGVLSQKEGMGAFEQLRKTIDEISPSSERKTGWTNRWINILELSLKHGLSSMDEALDYIPPSQISPLNFEERLRVEREIAETGENLVERIYSCSPGPGKVIQGVDFRGHCTSIAVIWGVARGYAKNNHGGTVAVLAQGDSRRINGFAETLTQEEIRRYNNPLKMSPQEDIPLAQAETLYEGFLRID